MSLCVVPPRLSWIRSKPFTRLHHQSWAIHDRIKPSTRTTKAPLSTASKAMADSSSSEDSTSPKPEPYFRTKLVTPSELHAALKSHDYSEKEDHRLIPISAAWFLPNDPTGRTGLSSYKACHIPNSRFFDLDTVIDNKSPFPHMLPSRGVLQRAMSDLGIRRSDTLVVYDTAELGIFSAPRVAWTLRYFGHRYVHVLNNFKLWVEDGGFPVESGEEGLAPGSCFYNLANERRTKPAVASIADVHYAIKIPESDTTILDARPRARWEGSAPEPRAGISSGHMPGSISVPFTDVLDPVTKALLPWEKLKELFNDRLDGKRKNVISTCGTGVTAAVIDLALAESRTMVQGRRALYDGSWTEWATVMKDKEGMIEKSEGVT